MKSVGASLYLSVQKKKRIWRLCAGCWKVRLQQLLVLPGSESRQVINLLNPKANMETGSISRKIERGKHTTRHSELFMIDEDSYIMDTPGFSSLYVNDFFEKKKS